MFVVVVVFVIAFEMSRWGSRLNTASRSSQLRSGGEHYQPMLALEDDAEDEEEDGRRTPGDIKSNSPHLTGGTNIYTGGK